MGILEKKVRKLLTKKDPCYTPKRVLDFEGKLL